MSTQKAKSTKSQLKKKTDYTNVPKNSETQDQETHAKLFLTQAPVRLTSVASTISYPASAPFCRICHDDDADEPLISPCDCKGSLNYCHASCLRSWLTEKVQNLKEPSCEICKCAYEVRYERVGRRDCGPCRQFRGRREFIHFVVMSFCIFVLAASIAYTSWGAFSSSELAINFRLSPLAELTYSVYFIIDALCVLVIIVEFNVGVWPIVKKWWSSNLSVVVIDKNNVAICTETLRVVEEASSLLEEEAGIEEEDGDEVGEERVENENDELSDSSESDEEVDAPAGGDRSVRLAGWWVKLWTHKGQANSGEKELEEVELGQGNTANTSIIGGIHLDHGDQANGATILTQSRVEQ